MKIGKVSESILKRSILKQIKHHRAEVLIGAGIGVDCAVLALTQEEEFVISTDPITGTKKEIGIYAVHAGANDIAAAGATPIGVMVSILLPIHNSEAKLKAIMNQIVTTCDTLQMQVLGGHTEVTPAVNQPIVTVTAVGKRTKDQSISMNRIQPRQDIVLTKWIGLEGTAILAKEKQEQLLIKYPKPLVEEAQQFLKYISVIPEAATAIRLGVCAMHDVTEGGIFGALWELGEGAGVGLQVEMKKLPIKQETVEICEFFDINPYHFISGGCMLMVTDNGYDLVSALEEEKIKATVIGKITEGNDRVVISNDERRFLEPPKPDELYKKLNIT